MEEKETKYILIDCWYPYYNIVCDICYVFKENGDYCLVKITNNKKQFDVKSLTKEEFDEVIKNQNN
jgi:hypothetical protein